MNAIIAKIKNILAEDIVFSDSTTGDASTSKHGYLAKLPGGAAYLRADGSWAAPSGDPAVLNGTLGTTDNAIPVADGTGAVTLKGSLATIDTSGSVNIPSGQKYKINGSALVAADVGAGDVTASGTLTADALMLGGGTTVVKAGTNLPTATTIGAAYIYRAGGTDVPYTDGGTGISTYPKRTIFLSGAGGVASTTAGCGAFETFETATNDVNFRSTIFAAGASDISKEWACVMPDNWDGGTVTAVPIFHVKAGTDAGNHTIIWNVAGMSLASTETLDTAYGTLQTSTYTVASSMAGKIIFGPATTAITIGGASPAGGEFVQWRVSREGDDTCTDTAYLLGVKIIYQTNGTSDA
jgi:hypothetical protein